MSDAIGIDLGTTHTVVCALTESGPEILHRIGESPLIPSVVAVDDTGTLLVGEAALARRTHRPQDAVGRFKREMGTHRTWRLGEHDLSATELSALVLREARAVAEQVLGRPVERAVITVPAYFGDPERAATRQAGELAGLSVARMINEPTAAAVAHGLADPETERRVLVIDLGGGTFDVTALEIFDGIVEVIASGGDGRLGGEDLTDALVARFRTKTTAAEGALRAACEEAKRALSHADAVWMDLPGAGRTPLTRAELARICEPLLLRMRTCISDTLRAAKLRADQIDEVVLAGGATRTPAVVDLIDGWFQTVLSDADPDHLIALGAAVQAGLVDRSAAVRDVVVTDVLSHSVGVHICKEGDDRMLDGYFLPVIHRNTTLPVRRVERVFTLHREQTSLKVQVFQGEHRYTRENRKLGQFELTDLPVAPPGSSGQACDIAFTHTLDGLLEVEATIVATGKKAALLIEGHAGRLNEAGRARAQAALEALKTHPRDLLPNRLLLERALARHARLHPEARAMLDGPLTAFEDALTREQPEAIEQAAATLVAALDHPALAPWGTDAPD